MGRVERPRGGRESHYLGEIGPVGNSDPPAATPRGRLGVVSAPAPGGVAVA